MAKLAMLVLVMALLITAPSGETSTAESHERDASKATKSHMHGRMRVLTDVQDYDYGGANSKHDPHRKPGGGH